MTRGRLIFPVYAQLYRLDTAATAAETNGGETASGYNPYFREPVVFATGDNSRTEFAPILLPVQVLGNRSIYGTLTSQAGGKTEAGQLQLVFHMRDLENSGLVDTNGRVLLNTTDRLGALYKKDQVTLIRQFTNMVMFSRDVHDRGIGLEGNRNLFLCVFNTRDKSTVTGIT